MADFFEQERDRLSREISSGFEELLSTANATNRKLEDVLGMTKEYDNIATLWKTFYDLMQQSSKEQAEVASDSPGVPGSGGHTVAVKQ